MPQVTVVSPQYFVYNSPVINENLSLLFAAPVHQPFDRHGQEHRDLATSDLCNLYHISR